MNIIKITSHVAVSVITTLAVATIIGFQFTEIIAEEVNAPEYLTAEGVEITGIFRFRDGEELVSFQQFSQISGFQRSKPYIFTMQKVVGNTPLLHKNADASFLYRNSELQKQNNERFDVDILLSTGPYSKRSFTYGKCFIDDYQVRTLTDNEEGYFNKGFAVVENYTIECKDMIMNNPALEEIMTTSEDEKAQTLSTLDLKEPYTTWSDHFKYQNTGSLKPKQ